MVRLSGSGFCGAAPSAYARPLRADPDARRGGWDMTEHVAFLRDLPVRAVLDGERVALDEQGKPDFPWCVSGS